MVEPINKPNNFANPNGLNASAMDGISPSSPSPDEYKLSGGIANLVESKDTPISSPPLREGAGGGQEPEEYADEDQVNQDQSTDSAQPSAIQEKKEALEDFRERKKDLEEKRGQVENLKPSVHESTSVAKAMADKARWTGEQLVADSQKRVSDIEKMYEESKKKFGLVDPAEENFKAKQVQTQKEYEEFEKNARAKQAAKEGREQAGGANKTTGAAAKELEESAAKSLVKEGAEAAEKAVAKDVAKAGAKGIGRLAPGLGFAMDAKETVAGFKDLGHGERPPASTILDLAEDILNVIPGGQPFVWASMLIRLSVRLLGEDEEEIAECLWPKASLLPPQVYYAAHPDELAVNLVKLAAILTRIFVKIVGVVVGLLVSIVIVLLVVIYVVLSTTTGILSQSPNFNGSGTQASGGGVASSGCAINTDNCSVEKLNSYGITNNCSRNGQVWNGEAMSRICTHESSGVAKMSGTDRCDQQVTYPDGHTGYLSWSGGLFQIDIFHASDAQFPECKGLVEVKSVTSSHASAHNTSHGGCLEGHWRNSASGGYCDLRKCGLKSGVTETQYKNCVNALFNNDANYKAACSKYKSQGYSAWVDSATKCGVISK